MHPKATDSPSSGPPARVRRILLVGFMAAGKTTVGRLLAERLGWRFLDVDEAIERETGERIADIFRTRGEAAFRALEAKRSAQLLAESDVVIAPGGGWAAMPGALDTVPAETVIVWLRVSAQEAVRRALQAGMVRPLLAGQDPLHVAEELIRQREPFYRRAELILDVDGRTPADIATGIEAYIRTV